MLGCVLTEGMSMRQITSDNNRFAFSDSYKNYQKHKNRQNRQSYQNHKKYLMFALLFMLTCLYGCVGDMDLLTKETVSRQAKIDIAKAKDDNSVSEVWFYMSGSSINDSGDEYYLGFKVEKTNVDKELCAPDAFHYLTLVNDNSGKSYYVHYYRDLGIVYFNKLMEENTKTGETKDALEVRKEYYNGLEVYSFGPFSRAKIDKLLTLDKLQIRLGLDREESNNDLNLTINKDSFVYIEKLISMLVPQAKKQQTENKQIENNKTKISK